MTITFEYVDKVIAIEVIIPSLLHTKKSKNFEILRTLENKDSSSRTIVVNSILFPIRKPRPL